MAITINVNGVPFTKYLKLEFEIQLDALSNVFSVEVATSISEPLPFQGGEECVLFVDGIKKLTGFLEAGSPNYDADSHSVTYSGRDNTSALVDSSLLGSDDLTPPISLKQVCENVIAQIGADIEVIQGTDIAVFNQSEDIIAIESGDNAFEFLQKLANKRQVLLTSNADGNLVITQSVPSKSNGRLQNLINDNGNNILSGSAEFDNSNRYNIYTAVSSLNPTAANFAGQVTPEAIVASSASVTDTEVRAGRQLVFRMESSSSSEECLRRAQWELNMRKARGIRYNVSLSGHTIAATDSEIWDINTLVEIADDFTGIFAEMLVNKVRFMTSLNGNDSDLELVHKDSYTLTVTEPVNTPDKVAEGIFIFP